MTGEELYRYVERRLGIGRTPDDDLTPEGLYDALTEARDEVLQRASLAAPRLFLTVVPLTAASDGAYEVPSGTRDPIAVETVRVRPTLARLTPSSSLDQDGGDYQWLSPRRLVLADHVDVGDGVELEAVLDAAPISSETSEAAIGLPPVFHRAVGKAAALLVITRDDRSDGRVSLALYERAMERLETRFAAFDGQGGAELREALLASYGRQYGDTLY